MYEEITEAEKQELYEEIRTRFNDRISGKQFLDLLDEKGYMLDRN